jgi:hypothetical protein
MDDEPQESADFVWKSCVHCAQVAFCIALVFGKSPQIWQCSVARKRRTAPCISHSSRSIALVVGLDGHWPIADINISPISS